jgi:hypothetical protein
LRAIQRTLEYSLEYIASVEIHGKLGALVNLLEAAIYMSQYQSSPPQCMGQNTSATAWGKVSEQQMTEHRAATSTILAFPTETVVGYT